MVLPVRTTAAASMILKPSRCYIVRVLAPLVLPLALIGEFITRPFQSELKKSGLAEVYVMRTHFDERKRITRFSSFPQFPPLLTNLLVRELSRKLCIRLWAYIQDKLRNDYLHQRGGHDSC